MTIASAALAVWLSRESAPAVRARTTLRAPAAPVWSWPSVSWGAATSSPSFANAGWAADAGFGLSDAAAPPPPPPEPILEATGRIAREVEQRICSRAARLVCAARAAFDCGSLPPDPYADAEQQAPQSCVEQVRASCGRWATRTYVDAPDVLAIDDTNVSACIAALTTDLRAGLAYVNLDTACTDLAINERSSGETCEASWYRCEDGDCMEHHCLARPGEDVPCEEGYCAAGLACIAGLCSRPTQRGATCDDESVCAQHGDACLFGRCVPFVPDRGECGEDFDCAVGSRCDVGSCRPARASGDACRRDDECGRGGECEGLWVSRCVPIGRPTPCIVSSDCALGHTCVDETCAPASGGEPGRVATGELCDIYGTADAQCTARNVCAWSIDDGHCAASLCALPDPFLEPPDDCH